MTTEQQRARAAAEMVRIGQSLYQRGYVHASAGNLSVRFDDDSVLITPTDAVLGYLDAQHLSHVSADGRLLSGAAPSKTLRVHRAIYGADSSARAVIHTHSTHLVALSMVGVWRADAIVPPITPYYVMKVGRVPLIAYHRPGDPKMAELIGAAIVSARSRGAPIRAVMHERLGPNVWHTDLANAMATLEELEETARLWLLGGRAVAPLSPAAIDELEKVFNLRTQ